MHQEDEPLNTISIDRTFGAIALGPQYNLQGGYFFESVLTVKRLRRLHWTPVNMNEYVIERYGTFNTKGCPEDLILADFNNQSIRSTYSDLKNDYDGDGNPTDNSLAGNEGLEYAVVKNDKNNNDKSLDSEIDPPPQKIFWKLKEWTEW